MKDKILLHLHIKGLALIEVFNSLKQDNTGTREMVFQKLNFLNELIDEIKEIKDIEDL
jgi:hypothetical protein